MRFIQIARRIQKRKASSYRLIEEGVLLSDHKVNLAEPGLAETTDKISCRQGDVLKLDAGYADFNLLLAANLIDRLPWPEELLSRTYKYLSSGGVLVIASPYDWQEAFTAPKHWLGGRFHAGAKRYTQENLAKILGKHFTAAHPPIDLEFVIRKTARTFHHSISQVSFWRREE